MKRTALALVAVVALTGCTSKADEPNRGINDLFREEVVTLNDGSTVTCLTYDRALDCDWKNR